MKRVFEKLNRTIPRHGKTGATAAPKKNRRPGQAAHPPAIVLHAVPPGGGRSREARRGQAGHLRGDGPGAGRAPARLLRGGPERPGLPRAASCQATPAGAGPLEGCPKGNPARRPAAEDRTSRGVPQWPAQGPRDPGGGAGPAVLRCMPA